MIPTAFEYARATSLRDALNVLAKGDGTKLIAGGHSLLPVMKFRLAQPPRLLDIAGLAELRGVEEYRKGARIGAATRCHYVNPKYDVIDGSPCFPDLAALPERDRRAALRRMNTAPANNANSSRNCKRDSISRTTSDAICFCWGESAIWEINSAAASTVSSVN